MGASSNGLGGAKAPEPPSRPGPADAIPSAAVGLRLCRILPSEELRMTEDVHFARGRAGVEITLRRAAISGLVEIAPKGDLPDYFADIIDASGDTLESVALDRASFAKLKGHWMRCRFVS